jgi:hypothetical protein
VKLHSMLYSFEFHISLLNRFIKGELTYDDMDMFILYVDPYLEHKEK